jgi:hypothetical protein
MISRSYQFPTGAIVTSRGLESVGGITLNLTSLLPVAQLRTEEFTIAPTGKDNSVVLSVSDIDFVSVEHWTKPHTIRLQFGEKQTCVMIGKQTLTVETAHLDVPIQMRLKNCAITGYTCTGR